MTFKLAISCVLLILVILTIILVYSYGHFSSPHNHKDGFFNLSLSLGTIGDFIGGTLNPLLSLLTIYLLTKSLNLQSKALNLTRLELKQSQKNSREQIEATKIGQDATLTQLELANKDRETTIRQLQSTQRAEERNFKLNEDMHRQLSIMDNLIELKQILEATYKSGNKYSQLMHFHLFKSDTAITGTQVISLHSWLKGDLKAYKCNNEKMRDFFAKKSDYLSQIYDIFIELVEKYESLGDATNLLIKLRYNYIKLTFIDIQEKLDVLTKDNPNLFAKNSHWEKLRQLDTKIDIRESK